ncbi:MAG TPA: EamA family transporter [Chthoniobacterales bacterium]|nr:EamA family transporter [Chthoniobacterales bacterium]
MTPWSLAIILIWMATFVSGQLLFKRAMESARAIGFRKPKTISILSVGILVMTMSFCLNLGLLQHFDLSYIYPFQGSSIIIITLLAAIILKERLTARLVIGTLVITAGVVLVSMS